MPERKAFLIKAPGVSAFLLKGVALSYSPSVMSLLPPDELVSDHGGKYWLVGLGPSGGCLGWRLDLPEGVS